VTRTGPMGSRSIGERNAIARRIAAVADRRPPDVELVHADLLPRALVERVIRSVPSVASLVDGPSGASVGLAEQGPGDWVDSDLEVLRRIAQTFLSPSTLTFLDGRATLPDAGELALFELRTGATSVRLYLDPRRLPARDEKPRAPPNVAWPIAISIEVASTSLVHRELRALGRGDVVTIDHDLRTNPVGRIPGANSGTRFTLANGELRFDGVTHGEGDSMDLDDDDTLVRIDDARVTLSVELARIATTVGELSGLVRGELFATGLPEAREVTLRLEGRAIARGELVTHDGELAVKILELATGDQ